MPRPDPTTLGLCDDVFIEQDGPTASLYDLRHRKHHALPLGRRTIELLALGRCPADELAEDWLRMAIREGWICRQPAFPRAIARRLLRTSGDVGFDSLLTRRQRRAYAALLRAHARRRIVNHGLGQCPALPETGLRRALRIAAEEPRSAVLLGDDDLVSIALAHLGVPCRVLDLDSHLLELLDDEAASLDLPIVTEQIDFRAPVRADLRGSSDAAVADPMSNRTSFEHVLALASSLLTPEGRLWMCAHAAAGPLLRRSAGEWDFDVTWHGIDFNNYYDPGDGPSTYQSDLFQLTPAVAPWPPDRRPTEGDAFYSEFVHTPLQLGRLIVENLPAEQLRRSTLDRLVQLMVGAVAPDSEVAHWGGDGDPWQMVVHTRTGFLTFRHFAQRGQLEMDVMPLDPTDLPRLRGACQQILHVSKEPARVSRTPATVIQTLDATRRRT